MDIPFRDVTGCLERDDPQYAGKRIIVNILYGIGNRDGCGEHTDRLEVLGLFCRYCGDAIGDGVCVCMRDD